MCLRINIIQEKYQNIRLKKRIWITIISNGINSKKIGDCIENFRFREASQHIIQLARIGNKYLTDGERKIININPERVKEIIYTAQIVVGLSIISEPILPYT